MENVCKDCGIFMLNHQEVCPCCGWVRDSKNNESENYARTAQLNALIESLTDNVLPDHFSGY